MLVLPVAKLVTCIQQIPAVDVSFAEFRRL